MAADLPYDADRIDLRRIAGLLEKGMIKKNVVSTLLMAVLGSPAASRWRSTTLMARIIVPARVIPRRITGHPRTTAPKGRIRLQAIGPGATTCRNLIAATSTSSATGAGIICMRRRAAINGYPRAPTTSWSASPPASSWSRCWGTETAALFVEKPDPRVRLCFFRRREDRRAAAGRPAFPYHSLLCSDRLCRPVFW